MCVLEILFGKLKRERNLDSWRMGDWRFFHEGGKNGGGDWVRVIYIEKWPSRAKWQIRKLIHGKFFFFVTCEKRFLSNI